MNYAQGAAAEIVPAGTIARRRTLSRLQLHHTGAVLSCVAYFCTMRAFE